MNLSNRSQGTNLRRLTVYTTHQQFNSGLVIPDGFPDEAFDIIVFLKDNSYSVAEYNAFIGFCAMFIDKSPLLEIFFKEILNGALPSVIALELCPDFKVPSIKFVVGRKVRDIRASVQNVVPPLAFVKGHKSVVDPQ